MAIPFFRNRRRQAVRKATRLASYRRLVFFENLEPRYLLAANWQNPLLATDVNADRRVTPMDALQVINRMESAGTGQLPELAAGVIPNAYYDATGDGIVSPLDALRVINAMAADSNGYVLTGMSSLSSHYIQATFDAPLKGALLSPDAYVLTGPDSGRLEVMSVAEGESPNQVILTTAAPAVGTLSVAFDPSVTAAISLVASIEGEKNDEFFLESSIALSNTSVLLTFSDLLDTETAGIESFYRILAVNDAAPAQDVGHVAVRTATVSGRTVILETSPLQNIEYHVKVTNVLDGYAKKLTDRPKESNLIDPTRNTATFFGIPQSNGLALSSAISINQSTVLLSFSVPVAENSVNPNKFSINKLTNSTTGELGAELLVLGSEVSQQGTRVTLTTLPQSGNTTYRVEVLQDGVTDLVGDTIDSTGRSQDFDTAPVSSPDQTKPTLVSTVATSPTTVVLSFSEPLAENAADPTRFKITNEDLSTQTLLVTQGQLSPFGTQVILTTQLQTPGTTYQVEVNGVADRAGNVLDEIDDDATRVFDAASVASDGSVNSKDLPALVGATSLSNTVVRVQFSKPMGDSALDPANYRFTIEGQQAGTLQIVRDYNEAPEGDSVEPIKWLAVGGVDDHSVVEIAVYSQSEVTYQLTVFNLRDAAGNRFPERPFLSVANKLIEPNSTTFAGTPPSGAFIDTDGDRVSDSEEQRGYSIQIQQADGTLVTQAVTSDPLSADTDEDGIEDFDERHYLTNPRNPDTDHDDLTDYQELNEVYSDPFNQDSDGDGLTDGLEFNFFRTSPLHQDTDGDQINDNLEIALANRNPRVADLPKPKIEVGDIDLQLDVRFTETTAKETRNLDAKSVAATISQSASTEVSTTTGNTQEVFAKLSVEVSNSTEIEQKGTFLPPTTKNTTGGKIAGEGGWTGTFNHSVDSTSATEAQQAYENSRTTEAEVTSGSTVERTVEGASMKVTVFLDNDSDLAYRVKNLQVTAFIQDPQDPTSLTPVATLLQDSPTEDGIALGTIDGKRGPFIFSNDSIFPQLVESLMKNPRGLVFQISNFDILDELDRNFAFASQDVTDRTAKLVLDFGGFDTDGDGVGDLTETQRVATSAGRPIADTNADGTVNEDDRRVSVDANGQAVGITLREALAAVGLNHSFEFESEEHFQTLVDKGILGSQITDSANDGQILDLREVPSEEIINLQLNIDQEDGSLEALDFSVTAGDFPEDLQAALRALFASPGGVTVVGALADGPAEEDESTFRVYRVSFDGAVKDRNPRIVLSNPADDSGVAISTLSLDDFDLKNSYTTFFDERGAEKIFRVRGTQRRPSDNREWFLITDKGIDDRLSLDEYVLRTGAGVTLAFYQDLDGDLVAAPLEFLHNTTDVLMDTDADGLDDRFEIFEGWSVNIAGHGERPVFSSPSLRDTDRDGLTDLSEALGARFDRRGRPIGLAGVNDNRLTLKVNAADAEEVSLQDALLKLNLFFVQGLGGDDRTLFSDVPSVDIENDTIFVGGVKGLSTGDKVTYASGGGTAIAPLTSGNNYFVINVGDGKIQLAATEQDADANRAIDLSELGTGAVHTITFQDTTTETKITFSPAFRTIQFITDDGDASTLASLITPDRELRLRIVDPGGALLATVQVDSLDSMLQGTVLPLAPLELVDVVGLMSGIEAQFTNRNTRTIVPLRMVYNAKTTTTEGAISTPGSTTGAPVDARGVVHLVSDGNELILVDIFNSEFELADARRALISEVRPTASAETEIRDSDFDGRKDTATPKGSTGDFPLQALQTDPSERDTDADGVSDLLEIRGFDVRLRRDQVGVTFKTDPTNPDTDGDTASDGLEKRLGGNPTDLGDKKDFSDNDNDGLVNIEELDGWEILVYATSLVGRAQGSSTPRMVSSDPNNPDTDGDGLLDGEEFDERTDPGGRPIDFNLDDKVDYNVFMSPDGDDSEHYIIEVVASDFSFRVLSGGVVEIDANGDGVLDLIDAVVNVHFPREISGRTISGGDVLDVVNDQGSMQVLLNNQRLLEDIINVLPGSDEPRVRVQDSRTGVTFFAQADGQDPHWRTISAPSPGAPIELGPQYSPTFSTDTDQDELTDFQEVRGFIPPRPDDLKIGVIVTDPTDADSDNDKLSDGVEAEMKDIEANRWIVRLEDKLPYRTYSDPLQADADFDRLVDGDEKYQQDSNNNLVERGTDPNNADSDGDSRLDGAEVASGLNPLKVELPTQAFNVTVVFDSLVIEDAGECGQDHTVQNRPGFQINTGPGVGVYSCDDKASGQANPGEFGFDLAVRKPSSSTASGLSVDLTSVIHLDAKLLDEFKFVAADHANTQGTTAWTFDSTHGLTASTLSLINDDHRDLEDKNDALPGCVQFHATLCRQTFGVSLNDGDTLQLAGIVPANQRSITFPMTASQTFAIEGVIVEGDAMVSEYFGLPTAVRDAGLPAYTYAFLGGISGLPWVDPTSAVATTASDPGIFQGTDLLKGKSLMRIRFPFQTSDTKDTGKSCNFDQAYQPGFFDSFNIDPTLRITGMNIPACLAASVERMGIKGYLNAYILISDIHSEFGSSADSTGGTLLAESIGSVADAVPILADRAQPLLAEAIDRFAAAGVDVSSLSNVQFLITDLPGATLGRAVGNVIYLDTDAAGHGWYLDNTPRDDSEFTTPADQGAQKRIDALTVISHELGHILGLEHADVGVMQPTLATGERHLPDASELLEDEILDALLYSWSEK